jgi:nucleoside 2-deoxyribosyltransferase
MTETMHRAYLAGPDVFLPDAAAHAARRIAICRAHGIEGLAPLDTGPANWRAIHDANIAMMQSADLMIANLTPFRGPSADAGTLVELGWFAGRGKPVFAYSNSRVDFSTRTRAFLERVPDPVAGMAVEGFALADNLMVPGAVGMPILVPDEGPDVPFDGLAIFERCVALAAKPRKPLGLRPEPRQGPGPLDHPT